MLGNIWNFVYQPFLWLLVELYKTIGSFGLAIIALTGLARAALFPLTLPSYKSMKKMEKIKPQIDELNKKHKGDKQKLASEQMKLYQEHGVNPMAGCLPQILQIFLVFVLYRVFFDFLQKGEVDGVAVNMNFLWLNLAKPDPYYIFPILAGVSQLALSLVMMNKEARKKVFDFSGKKKGEEKSTMEEFGGAMQKQMVLVMPVMIVFLTLKFPSGLALYWTTSSVFILLQQLYINKKYK